MGCTQPKLNFATGLSNLYWGELPEDRALEEAAAAAQQVAKASAPIPAGRLRFDRNTWSRPEVERASSGQHCGDRGWPHLTQKTVIDHSHIRIGNFLHFKRQPQKPFVAITMCKRPPCWWELCRHLGSYSLIFLMV